MAGDAEKMQDVPADGLQTPVTPNEPQSPAEDSGTILGGTKETQEPKAEAGAKPDVPDSYDFQSIVPDGMEYDAQAATAFGSIAHECGLSQEQAAKVAAYGMEYMKNGVNAAMAQEMQTRTKWGEDAKAQLGADYEKTVARAAVGIDQLSQKIPNLRAMLNETGAGNRIEMIQFMAAVGDLLGEDAGHGVPGYGGQKSLYPNTDFGQYR